MGGTSFIVDPDGIQVGIGASSTLTAPLTIYAAADYDAMRIISRNGGENANYFNINADANGDLSFHSYGRTGNEIQLKIYEDGSAGTNQLQDAIGVNAIVSLADTDTGFDRDWETINRH